MRLAIILAVGFAMTAPAWATTGTCTVSSATLLVLSQGFTRPLPGMVGYAIPVEITESTGAMSLDLTTFPGDTFDISGVNNSVTLQPGKVSGTLDRNGNVALPPVPVHFTTDLAPGVDLGGPEALITGLSAVTVSGVDYLTEGSRLNFTTGVMRIEGQTVITNAPVVGVASSGLGLECTLAPIPSASSLPKAPTMAVGGKIQAGSGTGVVGDDLTLKAKIKNGAATIDPTQDVFVRINVGDTTVFLVRVPAGQLTQKGKKSSGFDTGGTTIRVLEGRKESGGVKADVSGSITIVRAKKATSLTLKHTGGDFTTLSTASSAQVTVAVGSATATDVITVKGGKKIK